MIEISTATAEETREVGARLAACLEAGDVVMLHGDLGAGKTTLVQGVVEALLPGNLASSPTFTLHGRYAADSDTGAPIVIDHLDLYRLEGTEELASIGFGDLLEDGDSITFIEWPERAGDWLPDSFLVVDFTFRENDGRLLSLFERPNQGRIGACLARTLDSA